MRTAVTIAIADALAGLPHGEASSRERQRARLRAMYGVAELLARVDFSDIETQAGIHLAVVRALAPVFLDPRSAHIDTARRRGSPDDEDGRS